MALVGLHPSIIMTVCQKALSFWNYQMAQEQAILNSLYQNIVGKLKQLERPHMSDPHPSQEVSSVQHTSITEDGHLSKEEMKERQKVDELTKQLEIQHQQYKKLAVSTFPIVSPWQTFTMKFT
jgi:E3 ubiquitin-protein ligase CCNP1IP1